MFQKVFGVLKVDINAKKLLKRSQILLGVHEFQFVNFLCAHLYNLVFFLCYQERLLFYYRLRLTFGNFAYATSFLTCF